MRVAQRPVSIVMGDRAWVMARKKYMYKAATDTGIDQDVARPVCRNMT